MITIRIGKANLSRRQGMLLLVLALVILVMCVSFVLNSNIFSGDWGLRLSENAAKLRRKPTLPSKLSAGSCSPKLDCPEGQFSFFIHSGAGNVVPPKICLQNTVVLGAAKNNFGLGLNIVIMDGKTGEVVKTGSYDMYGGDVKPLMDLLQSLEHGSVVLMASYDEPSTKLTPDARKLIAELGSSAVHSLGFRDSWVFVGGKGSSQSKFEKHIKNDHSTNKYKDWPELTEVQGCIPKFIA